MRTSKPRWAPMTALVVGVVQAVALTTVSASAVKPASGTVLPPLNPEPQVAQGSLRGVDCPAEGTCVAVGAGGTGFVERWDGSSWSASKVPGTQALSAVSCPTARSCLAVGTDGDEPLAFRITPDAATPIALPSLPDVTLASVSCASLDFCVASGKRASYDPVVGHSESPVVVMITSTGGAAAALPKVGDRLTGVSCTSSSDCTAVGVQGYYTRNAQALLEHFGGTAWTVVPLPRIPGRAGCCRA